MSSHTLRVAAGRMLAAGALSVVVAGLAPMPAAHAATSDELQAQLDVARAQLESCYSAAEQAEYDLISVTNDLDATNEQISQLEVDIAAKQVELEHVQGQLSQIVSTQYKGGNSNLISILLGADSFDDLVSRVYYANRVSQSQQQVVSEAKDLKSSLEQQRGELEDQKAQQEQLVSDQQSKKSAADSAAASAQSYYDGLDEQVREQLAAEQAAAQEAARQAAAEMEAKLAEQNAQQGQGGSGATSDNSSSSSNSGSSSSGGSQTPSSGGSGSNSGSSSTPSTPSKPSSGGGSSNTNVPASGMIARAQAIIGSGYVYSGYTWTGSTATSYFTCSGVVDFALGYGPRTHSPEDYYAMVGNLTTDISQLKVGDLVFFTYAGRYPGHVGIYVGNNTMIDSSPGGGVQYRTVSKSSFIGGGSL